ncbi:hypothetical protein AVEN_7692-1 [Araneus ventricosus]|uniref:Uncharacterized protein n=1 Tax=Araneus ventricosus TaxID=182803 RepID=A0A4Y2XA41_ARAVE|nr:hypothetical protein AVEN_7692-1 [Araneus ventricosus]
MDGFIVPTCGQANIHSRRLLILTSTCLDPCAQTFAIIHYFWLDMWIAVHSSINSSAAILRAVSPTILPYDIHSTEIIGATFMQLTPARA